MRKLGYVAQRLRLNRHLERDRHLALVSGHWRVIQSNPGLTAVDVAQGNLELVVDALEQANIDHFVTTWPESGSPAVSVRASDRPRVARALERALAGTSAYLKYRGGGRSEARLVAAGGIPDEAFEVARWRIYRFYGVRHTDHVLGYRLGCRIDFWDEHEDGVLELPKPTNDRLEVLRPGQYEVVEREVGGRRFRTLDCFVTGTRFDDVTFPIDVVYTWVDGSDPEWQRKRARYQGVEPDHPEAANAARYLGGDDLRYSLRSLWTYAPFVRNIYIVTDDQVPDWLDTSHPQITMVDHRDIFRDPSWLPTFNSHAIETQLHHIPGLSEHYLYMNDDVFFGRLVTPDRFFHGNGITKFFPSRHHAELGPPMPYDRPAQTALKNDRELLAQHFGRLATQKMKHVPHPQRKSIQEEMEAKFVDAYEQTARARFRMPTDISPASVLHHYYAYLTGRAVPGPIRYRYVNSSACDLRQRLESIRRKRNYHVFCMNDTTADEEELEQVSPMIESFFADFLPLASPFER